MSFECAGNFREDGMCERDSLHLERLQRNAYHLEEGAVSIKERKWRNFQKIGRVIEESVDDWFWVSEFSLQNRYQELGQMEEEFKRRDTQSDMGMDFWAQETGQGASAFSLKFDEVTKVNKNTWRDAVIQRDGSGVGKGERILPWVCGGIKDE